MQLLDTAFRDTKTSLHFVDDQHNVVLVAQRSHVLHILLCCGQPAAVAHDRLDKECANVVAVLFQYVLERVCIIERYCVKKGPDDFGDTFPDRKNLGIAVFGIPVLDGRIPEHFAEYTVVSTLQDDVTVFTRIGSCNTQCGHDGFGARIRKSYKFRCRHHSADPLCDFVFKFCRQGEYAADFHAGPGSFIHTGIGIAQYGRAVGQPVIDVLVVVNVPESRAFCAPDVNGLVLAPVTEIR